MSSTAVLSEATDSPDRASDVRTEPVSLTRVLRAEWIKFTTLRSSWLVLGSAVAGMVLIALIVAYNTRHLSPDLQPDDLVPSSSMQGYYLGQLLIGALGVLFVSGEYSTGMIRSTFAAVPRRLPVLWAKLMLYATVTLLVMVPTALVAFLLAQAVTGHYRTGYSLGDPGVLRVVVGTGIYLTLVGLLGAAIAWIVRSTPGALVAYFATVLVLPVIFGNVLGTWGKNIARFMPSEAGGSFVSSVHQPELLTPWPGLAVMVAWVVVAVAVAAFLLNRRDA
ncbi:ABC transporter permease [Jatrophihabitans telluris]|uniref:ABC transporter permease n=1 Tax=Jatrophihabitans telluris TaxID=2038343 RepID=A0ABY4QT66_9ACTN|nr:ABC transporter permease subunit [Jatrophihabitans telluris]UQX86914.1 ABC transporter permease [Jatrophihabitans telluris]